MDDQLDAPAYHIWGVDQSAYGPVELPTLVNWIKDDRVLAETWIFVERDSGWFQAAQVPELKMFFKPKASFAAAGMGVAASDADLKPGDLRRIKVLAEMTDDQLAALLKFLDVVSVPPFTHLVHKGSPGDAIFGVLQGELRSALFVEGRECPLTTLSPGSIFGEISFFDRGPHAADVISNQESLLVKLTSEAMARLGQEAPDAARGLLAGIIQALAGRVRTLTRRYEDSVQIVHTSEAVRAA